uniref:Putative secreted protein 94 n=1 Tax=Amblyomma americanum TaxID=6943 RepID=A0A0C9S5A9_AMBAM
MFFVAALISVFALFAAENPKAEPVTNQNTTRIYNNSLAVVRRRGHLQLLWYSNGLQKKLEKCLISRFIKNETNGARRTLETNGKNPKQRTKRNITIFLRNHSDYVSLQIKASQGKLSDHWEDEHNLAYARKSCFVLEAMIAHHHSKPHCVVWGATDSKKSNSTDACFKEAEERCEFGTKVNLTQCGDETENLAKTTTQGPPSQEPTVPQC